MVSATSCVHIVLFENYIWLCWQVNYFHAISFSLPNETEHCI